MKVTKISTPQKFVWSTYRTSLVDQTTLSAALDVLHHQHASSAAVGVVCSTRLIQY
jgi:hypothetical protein